MRKYISECERPDREPDFAIDKVKTFVYAEFWLDEGVACFHYVEGLTYKCSEFKVNNAVCNSLEKFMIAIINDESFEHPWKERFLTYLLEREVFDVERK